MNTLFFFYNLQVLTGKNAKNNPFEFFWHNNLVNGNWNAIDKFAFLLDRVYSY